MSYKTGFYEGRLGIGLGSTMGMGDGNPRYPLDINGDIRLTGSIVNGDGQVLSLTPAAVNWTIDDDDIFFTSGGNVGIGTATPGYPLDVDGEVYINHYLGVRPGYKLSFGNPGTSYAAIEGNTSGNGNLYFQTNGSYRMHINPSGNVGIGTTSPTSKLTLNGGGIEMKQSTHYETNRPSAPSNGSAVQDYEIASYGGSPSSVNGGSYPNDSGFLRLRAGNNGNHTRIDLSAYTTSTSHDCHKTITFYTDATERMRINSQGKVGIGVAATTLYNNNYQLQVSSGCKAGYFNTAQSIAMGSNFKFSWGSQDSTGAAIQGHASNHTLQFWTGSSERMRITNTGVGIGTTNVVDTRAILHLPPAGTSGIAFQATTTQADSRNWRIRHDDYGAWGSIQITCGDSNTDIGNSASDVVMTMTKDRNVIINGKLTFNEGVSGNAGMGIIEGYDEHHAIYIRGDRSNVAANFMHFYEYGDFVFSNNGLINDQTEKMRIKSDGNVGIGMVPGYKLDVNGAFRHKSHMEVTNIGASPKQWTITHYFSNGVYNGGFIAVKDERNGSNSPWGDGASLGLGEKRQGTYYLGIQLRGYTCYANTSGLGNQTVSDNRIKKDIEDVPDNYALQKVRDLPCRYYNYKHEPKNGEHKVVGFIAQEVKQHLPGCVNEGEMPSCMPTICEFVNVTWEKIGVDERDPSKNVFKIKCDEFEKYSNETHRFYFSNDGSINDENVFIRETPKEEDNSFVITEIDEPYDYVYVYGASQSDFLTIKKDQIFALHHSAIQELDRKVIALENENAELKAELAAIKQHLGI